MCKTVCKNDQILGKTASNFDHPCGKQIRLLFNSIEAEDIRSDQYGKYCKNRNHHTQILSDFVTKAFGKTRDATGLFDDIPEKERPTFHEIRALGIMLYEKQGINPDNLAGHMTEEMKKLYRSGHGIQWTEAASI